MTTGRVPARFDKAGLYNQEMVPLACSVVRVINVIRLCLWPDVHRPGLE